jgi:predicted Zn-dependent peptidase
MGAQEILTDRILNVEQVESIIDAVTTDEMSQLARELIIDTRLRLAVVGPVTKDEPLAELLKL